MTFMQRMDASNACGRGSTLGMVVIVMFAVVLRCGAISGVPDRFRPQLAELGVPDDISWPTRPPTSPPKVMRHCVLLDV